MSRPGLQDKLAELALKDDVDDVRGVLSHVLNSLHKMKKADSEKLAPVLDSGDLWSVISRCLRGIFPPETPNFYSDQSIFYELHEPLVPFLTTEKSRPVKEYILLDDFPFARIKVGLEQVLALIEACPQETSLRILERYLRTRTRPAEYPRIADFIIRYVRVDRDSPSLAFVVQTVFELSSVSWLTFSPEGRHPLVEKVIQNSRDIPVSAFLFGVFVESIPLVRRPAVAFAVCRDVIGRCPELGSEFLHLLHKKKCYSARTDELYLEEARFLQGYVSAHPDFWPHYFEIDFYSAWECLQQGTSGQIVPLFSDIFLVSLLGSSAKARMLGQVVDWALSTSHRTIRFEYDARQVQALASSLAHYLQLAKVFERLVLSIEDDTAPFWLREFVLYIVVRASSDSLKASRDDVGRLLRKAVFFGKELAVCFADRIDTALLDCLTPLDALLAIDSEEEIARLDHGFVLTFLCGIVEYREDSRFLNLLFRFLLNNKMSLILEHLGAGQNTLLQSKPVMEAFWGAFDDCPVATRLSAARLMHGLVRASCPSRRALLEEILASPGTLDEDLLGKLAGKDDFEDTLLTELYCRRKDQRDLDLYLAFLHACPGKVQYVRSDRPEFLLQLFRYAEESGFLPQVGYSGEDVRIWRVCQKFGREQDQPAIYKYALSEDLRSEYDSDPQLAEVLAIKLSIHPHLVHCIGVDRFSGGQLLRLLNEGSPGLKTQIYPYVLQNLDSLFRRKAPHVGQILLSLIPKRREVSFPADFFERVFLDLDFNNVEFLRCLRLFIAFRFKECFPHLPRLLGKLPFGTRSKQIAKVIGQILAKDLLSERKLGRRKSLKYLQSPVLRLISAILYTEEMPDEVLKIHQATLLALLDVFLEADPAAGGSKRRLSRSRQGRPLDRLVRWANFKDDVRNYLKSLLDKLKVQKERRRHQAQAEGMQASIEYTAQS